MKCVLIEDDDPQVLSLTARWLNAAGYDAVMSNDFSEARIQMQVCEPSVVVADVRLGSFNGIQLAHLARHIRADAGVVIISGWDDPVLRREAAQIGAEYLQKPFQAPELLAAIGRATPTSAS